MNLEFIMATEAPDGTSLEEPGIEYIEWDTPSMDCTLFMDGKNESQAKEYAKILSWVLTVGLVANSLASAVNGLMADVLGYNAIMIMASIMLIVALFLVITAISIAGRKAKK